jgi:transcriptional regulator with XRE-family HTH domain
MGAVNINPAMLAWARETAGFSLEQAAEKLAVRPNSKATAAEKLAAVERGERPVSQGLLDKAVTPYKRPLLTFYLEQPPPRGDRGEDFRTLAVAHPPRENVLLDALVRNLKARQQLVRQVLIGRHAEFVSVARAPQGA